MTRERERKFDADPSFVLPDLDDVVAGVHATAPREAELDARYHDSEDLRLLRWGATLRHRSDEGWTLKLPVAEGLGAVMSRLEVHLPGGAGDPPDDARLLTVGYSRGAPLQQVARLVTRRRTVLLHDADDQPLAEVALDDVTVHLGDGVTERFQEVEVEQQVEGVDDLVGATVERLRDAGAGEPVTVPKLVRALGPTAASDPDLVVPDIPERPTAGQVIHAALARSAHRYVSHLPHALLGDDPEGVHQARVATRRLRSDLRTFRPLLDHEQADALLARVRPLAQLLGAVRDADVLLARLEELRDRQEPADHVTAKALLDRARRERDAAYGALRDGLGDDQHLDALEALYAAATEPPLTSEAERPAAGVLRGVVAHPWKRLRDHVGALSGDPSDEELHESRILTKRLRYAAEAVVPTIGEPAAHVARQAAKLQDVLGVHQDAVTIRTWLRGAVDELDPVAAYVAGEFAGLERARQTWARDRWEDRWERLNRKRLRRWMTS